MISICCFSCQTTVSRHPELQGNRTDSILQTDFSFKNNKDSTTDSGEQLIYHKNGVIEMRGMLKNNKREGLWKSWYENGLPWSATMFKQGKKNGKTTTWYENGNKRYEGFFKNDEESGRWTFWDEQGTIVDFKNYDLK